jgi:hypothetical protein
MWIHLDQDTVQWQALVNVHSWKQKIGCLVYANGWPGGTVVTITLLFTFIMILLTVRLTTHLEQTKSVCAIIYLYVKILYYA